MCLVSAAQVLDHVPLSPAASHCPTAVLDPAGHAAAPPVLAGCQKASRLRWRSRRRLQVTGDRPDFHYGLERAEDLAGIGIAVVIWASAAFAGYESIRKLLEHGHTSHVAAGIAGTAIGILGNQIVARYKLAVGRRINSATLIADARHSWLDALSSAVALAGLIAVAVGQPLCVPRIPSVAVSSRVALPAVRP